MTSLFVDLVNFLNTFLSLRLCDGYNAIKSESESVSTRSSLKQSHVDQEEDEIANVNFFHDDIVVSYTYTFTQRTPVSIEFGEITQNKGHNVLQGHSRSSILIPIDSS